MMVRKFNSEQSILQKERPTDPLLPSTKITRISKNLVLAKSLKFQWKRVMKVRANVALKQPNLTFTILVKILTSLSVTNISKIISRRNLIVDNYWEPAKRLTTTYIPTFSISLWMKPKSLLSLFNSILSVRLSMSAANPATSTFKMATIPFDQTRS